MTRHGGKLWGSSDDEDDDADDNGDGALTRWEASLDGEGRNLNYVSMPAALAC